MVVASENGTHVYAVAGFGERPGGRVKEAPPLLLLLLSGIIDLIRPLSDTDGTRGFFSFFCSIARVDGGSRGGRSTVVKVRAGGEGEGRGEGRSSGLCSLVG